MVRMANDRLTYDPIRAKKMLGTVIKKNANGGFEFGRVSTDVIHGEEVLPNGFIGSSQYIKDATAILIGVAPNWRGSRIIRTQSIYTILSKDLNCPIFIMGSGSGTITKLWIADEDSMEEFFWKK